MHLAGPVLLLTHLAALVTADTEIINFRNSQTLSHAPAVQEFSPILTPSKPSAVILTTPSRAEGRAVPKAYQELSGLCKIKPFDVKEAHGNGVVIENGDFAPCPGDTWIILNTTAQGWGLDRLTAWITGNGSEAFTLRASWAASTPAEVSLRLFCIFDDKGRSFPSPAPCTTGRYAARVRVTNGKFTKVPIPSSPIRGPNGSGAVTRTQHPVGLLFPGWVPEWLNPPPVHGHRNAAATATAHSVARHDTIQVHLVLEPLLLGVLPRSLLPWLGMLLCGVGMGLVIAPPVSDWFTELAQAVRRVEEKKGN